MLNTFSRVCFSLFFFTVCVVANAPDANGEQNNGNIALNKAVRSGDIAKAQSLIREGADVNSKSEDGDTPLIAASGAGHVDMVKFLIAKGADINARGRDGETALHQTAAHGRKDIAELLIARGANVDAKDKDGWAPLHVALVNDRKEMAKLLIANGADASAKSGAGGTCLQYATMMGQVELAKLLIARGADVNAKGSYHRTCLHIAASYGRKDVAELLISSGADVNAEDWRGYTPLYFAALKQGATYKDLAALLRKRGANLSDKVGDGVQESDERSGVPQEGKVRDWHVPFVSSIAFSPDGQSLAACYHRRAVNRPGTDGVSYVMLWDLKTKDERHLICEQGRQGGKTGPAVGPYQAVFTADGRTLLVAGGWGGVKAINVGTGEQIPGNQTTDFRKSSEGVALSEFGQEVTAVASSPDGQTIATGDRFGIVRLRDAVTGKPYRTFEQRIGRVACLAFSPNGQTLATGGCNSLSHRSYPRSLEPDNTIKLWDITTGQSHKSLKGHERPVRSLVFSPDGTKIASIDGPGVLKVWNLQTGKEQLTHLQTTTLDSPYKPICFSLDSSRVSVRFYHFGISTWDVATGEVNLRPFPKELKLARYCGPFYPNCGKVVFAGADTIRLWDFKTKNVRDIVHLEGRPYPMALSPDGKLLALAELNNLTLWDLVSNRAHYTVDTGANVPQFLRGHVVTHQRCIRHLAFSPNSSIVAASQEIYGLQFWDTTQGRLIRSLDTRTILCNIQYAAFSPDGKILATCGEDSVIARLWDVETGKLVSTIK